MSHEIVTVATTPYDDQIPGTSGLRRKTKVYQQENYLENFTQSIINAIGPKHEGCSLLVGGDGRYLCKYVAEKIVQICAANGVTKVYVGQHARFSTPAAAHFVEMRGLEGAFILTASHNPGGPDADFGIKFNGSNGGPVPPSFSDLVVKYSSSISRYSLVPTIHCDVDTIGTQTFDVSGKTFTVEVVSFIDDYVALMKEIFDFEALRNLIHGKGFRILMNSLNGITGPYLERIFLQELQAAPDCVENSTPIEDFGGLHPDPNLTYAADFVARVRDNNYDFGSAFDADGDRNMILGAKGVFVTPSDSLAILADNLELIEYFKRKVTGVARSMPTSRALDRVAEAKNLPLYITPTGWKYFVDLIAADKVAICGEESFGTGSIHIKEKDGIWAALAWLSIISAKNKSVEEIVKEHWLKYGRDCFLRYDYEDCESEDANKMMEDLGKRIETQTLLNNLHDCKCLYSVERAENFSFTNPIDGSVSDNQGYQIFFKNGSRFALRLSGTGTSGATIRLTIETYMTDPSRIFGSAQDLLDSLIEVVLKIIRIKEFTGREKPTVIT